MQNVKFVFERNGIPETVSLDIPGNWNECDDRTFPLLAALFLIDDEVMNRYQRAAAALTLVLGDAWEILEVLPDEQLYGLMTCIDWVFEKVDITINKIPFIQMGEWHYALHGPADELKNMRFAEWCVADTYYVAYSKTQDPAMLDRLLAVLYREKGKGKAHKRGNENYCGDIRQKFNDSLLDDRQLILSRLTKIEKRAIYLWFACCRQVIIKEYPEVFDQAKKDPNAKPSLLEADGWFGVYDDLRGDPRFGGPEKLEQEFVHTVFASVSRSQIKHRQYLKENGL